MIEALRAAGVAKTDLQTQDVSVSPRWNDRGRQDGFTAHTSVQVHVQDVRQAGRLIDAAVAAGATETSGPSFDRGDRDALYRGALKDAFAEARLNRLGDRVGRHVASEPATSELELWLGEIRED